MILVVSPEKETHTQAVWQCLQHMSAHVTLVDLAEFPQQAQVAMHFGASDGHSEQVLSKYEHDLDLRTCRVVWWRQPQPFVLHPELTDRMYRFFAYTECQSTIAGLWLALDAFWVNHPLRSEEAVRKGYQLKVAQAAGLTIPATLITNSPSWARAFVHEHGLQQTVYRSFSTTTNAWDATKSLQPHQLSLLDSVCYAPVVFQAYMPVQTALQAVVVGDQIFTAASPTQASDGGPTHALGNLQPYRLPTAIETQLRTFVRRLGLTYAVVHLWLTMDERFVFHEIDPVGPWLDLEQATGQPITQTIAHLLYRKDHRTPSQSCVHLQKHGR